MICLPLSVDAKVALKDYAGRSLDLNKYSFLDESGNTVALRQYFGARKPVILVPIYFACPGICNSTLNNLVSSLKQILPTAGRAFEVIVFSFDSKDSPVIAFGKKMSYLQLYARPESASGWHFLTTDAATSLALTKALGFEFEQDAVSGQFNHPAAVYVLSPEGIISVIFSGTVFPHKDLQRAIREASEGKVEVLLDRISAICYAYMPHAGILNSPKRWALAFFLFFAMSSAILFSLARRQKI